MCKCVINIIHFHHISSNYKISVQLAIIYSEEFIETNFLKKRQKHLKLHFTTQQRQNCTRFIPFIVPLIKF